MKRTTFAKLLAAVALVAAGQLVWLVLKVGGDFATTAFTDILGIPCAFAAAVACAFAARREHGRAARAWALMGVATASWGVGEFIWTYYEIVRRVEVPFPGWADVGFLGVIPFGAAALLSFPSAPRGLATRFRALLEGLIIAGSVLFIGWATVLGPMVRDGSGNILLQVLSIAYPVGDIVIIAVGFYVITRAGASGRLRLGLIGGGLLSIAMADVGFTYLTLHEAYAGGSLIDPLWNIGFLLIAVGALRPEPVMSVGVHDDRRLGPVAMLAPYVAFLAASAVAIAVQVTAGALSPFLFWSAITVVLFVVARQIVALWDNYTLNRDLESRVHARTAELEDALRDLAESHRLQDEFVANTSHELRTPLTVILGSLETLSSGLVELSPEAQEMSTMAQRSATRLQHLIEDVLLAAGLDGAISCQQLPFDARDEVRTVLDRFESARVVHAPLLEPTPAIGDPERFRVVLHHLLANAEKFAPRETAIHVDCFERDGMVHATVRDEGQGVPADKREAIFRRFYQLDGSSTRAHGGLGLGLFLARQIIRAMDGDLVIDDTDTGACFRVVVPSAVSTRRPEASGDVAAAV